MLLGQNQVHVSITDSSLSVHALHRESTQSIQRPGSVIKEQFLLKSPNSNWLPTAYVPAQWMFQQPYSKLH